jgi:hypothetical protein
VKSKATLYAAMRLAGYKFNDKRVSEVADEMVIENPARLEEVPGKYGAQGFRATSVEA